MDLILTEYKQFSEFWLNKKLDFDGVPNNQPYQCADVPKAFQNQIGIRVYPFGSPDGGVWSSGKQVFNGEARCIDPNGGVSKYGRYETKFINSHLELQKGDYVYFYNTQSNPYGHIGLFEGVYSNKIRVFNQNYSTTYCKYDDIPQNLFARGLRIIFLEEKNNQKLNTMERDNIKEHINDFDDILKKPDKHLNNVSNNKTDDFVFDLLLALRNERQNNELKDKLVKCIEESQSINKVLHTTNIRKIGTDGVADSFCTLIKAIDDLRYQEANQSIFEVEKLQMQVEKEIKIKEAQDSQKKEIPVRVKKDLNINNLLEDIQKNPLAIVSIINDIGEEIKEIKNKIENKKKD